MKRFTAGLLLIIAFFAYSDVSAQTPDSTINETTKIVKDKLTRTEQLEVLDYVLKSQFDIPYEIGILMENMDDKEREDILHYVMKKAKIPIKPKGEFAKIYWKEVEYDFGRITSGKRVSHVFNFQNIGDIPFKIESVEPSCGCTVPTYTQGVINPGESGQLIVTYNSAGKRGEITELVTVTGNTFPKRAVLVIYADVR